MPHPVAKFEPSGTHIQNGFLKVRIDLYPNPTSKVYPLHYVDKPDRPYTEEELEDEALQDLVPRHKELNPCLCHFIKIDPNTTKAELEQVIRNTFDADTVSQLDDVLSEIDRLDREIAKTDRPSKNLLDERGERRKELIQLMHPKSSRGRIVPYSTDANKLVKEISSRFKGLEVEVGFY